jgi:hypothetical protein
MFLITNDTSKFVVVQSNELVEATYSPELTTRAHKVARFILSLISPDDKDLKLYTVPINSLKTFLGYKENTAWGNFYPEIRDIAERLNQEPIVIKSGEKVTTAYFIAGYEIDSLERTITFEVSLLLKPYLLALRRNFTRYPLNYISRLRSAYSIRLYELLCQYKTIGYRTFELSALQMMLGSDYAFYGNFKDKVLNIAKRDLVANTDIDFEYDEIKTARRVTAIKFRIFSNKNSDVPLDDAFLTLPEGNSLVIPLEETLLFSPETMHQLLLLGLSKQNLEKYTQQGFNIISDEARREQAVLRCNNNLETYYIEKLTICLKSSKEGKRNQTGFLVKALQEDWQLSSPPVVKARNAAKVSDTKQKETHLREVKKLWDAEKQKIFDAVHADTDGFMAIFEEVKAASGASQYTIFPETETPSVIFKKNGMAANLIKVRIENLYAERFSVVNAHFQKVMQEV